MGVTSDIFSSGLCFINNFVFLVTDLETQEKRTLIYKLEMQQVFSLPGGDIIMMNIYIYINRTLPYH